MKFDNNRLLKVILYLTLLLLAFSVRVTNISYRSIWMDESRQAGYASQGFFSSKIVGLAASQNQPPLDYYLEAIGIRCFGLNEVGIRIHAVFLGALACLLFFIFLKKYYGLISAFLGYILFTFNPWLIRYSVEGRPYSTAVFCAVLFIFMLHRFLADGSFRNFIYFVLVQFLFLCSIAVQPVILIFSFVLFSVVSCLFFEKQNRFKGAFYILRPSLLAFILFLPFFNKLLKYEGGYLAQGDDLIRGYTSSDFFRFYTLANDYKYLLLVGLIFYILTIFLYKRHEKRHEFFLDIRTRQIRLILLGVFISFPVIYYFIFHLTLQISIKQRYILVFLPVILSVVSIGFEDFVKIIELKFKGLRCKNLIYIFALVCLLVMFNNNLKNNDRFLSGQVRDWRKFYSVVKEDINPGDVMILASIITEGYRPGWFCQNIYFKDYLKDVSMLRGDKGSLINELKKVPNYNDVNQKVYFTFINLDENYRKIIGDKDNFKGQNFRYIDVYGLKTIEYWGNSKNLIQKVIFFLEYTTGLLPETEAKCGLIRQLINIYLDQGKFEKAEMYLNRLKNLDKGNYFKEYITKIEGPLDEIRLNPKIIFSDEDLVAYWSMNEGSGTKANNEAKNDNTGVITDATWVDGVSGKCLAFNGTSTKVDCGYNSSLDCTNAISISFWMKPDATTKPIIARTKDIYQHKGPRIYLYAKYIQFGLGNGSSHSFVKTNNFSPLDGDWHHIVCVWDGTTMRTFRNGVMQTATEKFTGPIVYHDDCPLSIGLYQSKYFDGLIDEVRIYNKALSTSEVWGLHWNPGGIK